MDPGNGLVLPGSKPLNDPLLSGINAQYMSASLKELIQVKIPV